jgi:hypothetical protein
MPTGKVLELEVAENVPCIFPFGASTDELRDRKLPYLRSVTAPHSLLTLDG